MSTPDNIQPRLKKGDRVAYDVHQSISTGHHSTGLVPVRRTGIVQGWRDGKVIVLHKAGYTEALAQTDLILID